MSRPDTTVRDGIVRVRAPGSRWLATGWDGGYTTADAVYNISVPAGWDRTDIAAYATTRRSAAGFTADGPTLFTSAAMANARGAHSPPVTAYATVGLSNPAALPMTPTGEPESLSDPRGGTVNVIAWAGTALTDGGLANLLATVVEARTATLLAETGFPGTTTDATVVGCDPTGDAGEFTGSATRVGAAARACVREAVRAALEAIYPDGKFPRSVADAEYGVTTTRRADVFSLD